MKIRNVELSKSKYNIKCPYEMKAEFIVVHETDNIASAEEEVTYMQRNNNEVSFHFAVDDKEAIQCLPLNRNAWHCGDGATGNGNRCGIAVEICYNYCKDEETWKKKYKTKYEKAEINATKLIAKLLYERKWGISRVKKHQDFNGKNCPRRIIANGWTRFLNMVQAELDILNKPKATTTTTKPTTTTKTTFKVGDKVVLSAKATKYQGASKGVTIPSHVKGKTYTVQQISANKKTLLLKEIVSWVLASECKLKSSSKSSANSSANSSTKKVNSTSKKKTLILPKTATHWNVYPTNKKPVVGNECGALNPSLFGGLTYEILATPQKNVVTIKTRDYGKVNIYVGSETGAIIK